MTMSCQSDHENKSKLNKDMPSQYAKLEAQSNKVFLTKRKIVTLQESVESMINIGHLPWRWLVSETRRSMIYQTRDHCVCLWWPGEAHSTPWLVLPSWAQGLQLPTTAGTLQRAVADNVVSRNVGQDHWFCFPEKYERAFPWLEKTI